MNITFIFLSYLDNRIFYLDNRVIYLDINRKINLKRDIIKS
jgi:hypothetical protein